jgi:hypothetical protein
MGEGSRRDGREQTIHRGRESGVGLGRQKVECGLLVIIHILWFKQ